MLIRTKIILFAFSVLFSMEIVNAQGTYLGVYNTSAANPGCGSSFCHETMVTQWETSTHATAQSVESPGYGYSCLSCHNTGWNPEINNGGADEFVTQIPNATPDYNTSPGWEFLTNVQCEACHGPVGDEDGILDWNHTNKQTDFTGENCGTCHEGEHHPYYSEWQESGHASGAPAWLMNRSTNSSCFYCHFAQDFKAFLEDPEYNAANFTIEGGDENLADITCIACHDPHGNENYANIRNLPAEFADKLICDVCHNLHEEEIDFRDTPHHATSEVFSRNPDFGWRYPGEDYGQANSFHTLIRERCVACHMHTTPINYATGEAAVTGHKFEPRVEACVECHADYMDVVDVSSDETKFDYRGAQTMIKGLITTLENLLASASSADSTTDRFLQAQYNLLSAKAEGSNGIHNTALVKKLLEDAIARMNLTDITENEIVPVEYALSQNYPNPFNPSTTINFTIPQAANVKITVYDALGKETDVLVNEFLNPGTHSILWNASQFTSGVYIYKLETPEFVIVKKMLLVK